MYGGRRYYGHRVCTDIRKSESNLRYMDENISSNLFSSMKNFNDLQIPSRPGSFPLTAMAMASQARAGHGLQWLGFTASLSSSRKDSRFEFGLREKNWKKWRSQTVRDFDFSNISLFCYVMENFLSKIR